MAIGDLMHFDEGAYISKISQPSYPDDVLRKNIYRKRRQTVSSRFAVGAGVGLAHVTGGASLASSAYGARTLSVASQKLVLLEREWERREHPTLPEHFMRDTVLPMAISTAVGAATVGFDLGLSAAAVSVPTSAGHAVHQAAYGVATHASGAVPQIESGLETGLGEAARYATSGAAFPAHGACYIPLPYGPIGEVAGVASVKEVVDYSIGRTALAGQEYVAKGS
ncbi:hypothetical protein BDY19DRAFT_910324 [Irpex rosettiformis]|uniref:Uncharacterized protein n=1 Tax=Irpex rosettiformis TaxID=378272 RepID=A0ACB8TPB5_9APHY|nr:hypothetical protein BDY19DRAFT_910324 [Irpex rosettiformis]